MPPRTLACAIRWRPSKPNGRVTTPTVRMPRSLAISATTGAAPDPVPPPIPAVTNTKSAPATACAISSRLSSAACRPTMGLPPAPSPRVMWLPMLSLYGTLDLASACASVLMALW